ncbi:hypothetical protein B0H11DRAFT_2216393 [Mycena galericulata]|nr:hypothetical protein B0H11DRAFT_2216393 [Mycena galericulata]
MDFAMTSQLPGDGEQLFHAQDIDIVGSSQPFEDGEEDLRLPMHENLTQTVSVIPTTNSEPLGPFRSEFKSKSSRSTRQALSTREPAAVTLPLPRPARRNSELVRRVSNGPSPSKIRALQIERKREEAREEARRIVKKIRALATATARLSRKHRRLCTFIANPVGLNKENVSTN